MNKKHLVVANDSGSAITEFSMGLSLFIILCFGAVDCGTGLVNLRDLENATREGARLAVTLSNLNQNDSRVDAAVRALLNLPSTMTNLTVTNTLPIDVVGVVNSTGQPCSSQVTVQVSAVQNFPIGGFFGANSIVYRTNTTMRYQQQSFCT